MVCTANDLLEWKDFPKGLRVLLLDEDINSATEISSKLEEMDYVGQLFQLQKLFFFYFIFNLFFKCDMSF